MRAGLWSWTLKSIPIAKLYTGNAIKIGEQIRCIVEKVLDGSKVIGSAKIRIHTITSKNEPAIALVVALLTKFVRSVRCAVHTIELCFNDVCIDQNASWSSYLTFVNDANSYLNQHPKVAMHLNQKQLDSGLTQDHIYRLYHEIQTRWNSNLGAMLLYMKLMDHIHTVGPELYIDRLDRLFYHSLMVRNLF